MIRFADAPPRHDREVAPSRPRQDPCVVYREGVEGAEPPSVPPATAKRGRPRKAEKVS